MRYLLDTHTFVWLDSDPAKLSSRAAAICTDESNDLLLSLASVWEMQIKIQLGKLTLPASLKLTIENQIKHNQIKLLSIELTHVIGLSLLPDHHKDPFDRLLVSQANSEQISLITNDPQIAAYTVKTVW